MRYVEMRSRFLQRNSPRKITGAADIKHAYTIHRQR